jgi:hypothetical protein
MNPEINNYINYLSQNECKKGSVWQFDSVIFVHPIKKTVEKCNTWKQFFLLI